MINYDRGIFHVLASGKIIKGRYIAERTLETIPTATDNPDANSDVALAIINCTSRDQAMYLYGIWRRTKVREQLNRAMA